MAYLEWMKHYLQEAARKGGAAAKQNLIPGIVLQVLALALIFGYYQVDSFRAQLDVLGELNTKFGLGFAVMVTMVFGGAIPLSIEALQAKSRAKSQRTVAQVVFTLALWGANGAITALFYQGQDWLFGSELNVLTVLKKVLVDQFVWVPIYVIPVFTLLFLWRDKHFSLGEVKSALAQKSFLSRGLPLMISNWAVWIPAVSIIYAFPLSLQMVLMNLILVFWSLILTIFIAD